MECYFELFPHMKIVPNCMFLQGICKLWGKFQWINIIINQMLWFWEVKEDMESISFFGKYVEERC